MSKEYKAERWRNITGEKLSELMNKTVDDGWELSYINSSTGEIFILWSKPKESPKPSPR